MTVQSLLAEKEKIDNEIRNLRERIRYLNKRKKDIEYSVVHTLNRHNKKEYKFRNNTYKVEEKQLRKRKTEKQKKQDVLDVLKKYNIPNASNVYSELQKSLQGVPSTTYQVKKETKNKKS